MMTNPRSKQLFLFVYVSNALRRGHPFVMKDTLTNCSLTTLYMGPRGPHQAAQIKSGPVGVQERTIHKQKQLIRFDLGLVIIRHRPTVRRIVYSFSFSFLFSLSHGKRFPQLLRALKLDGGKPTTEGFCDIPWFYKHSCLFKNHITLNRRSG